MKELLVVLALLATTIPAQADWTRVTSSKTGDVWADPATMRKRGNFVKIWVLHDLYKADQVGRNPPYLSLKSQNEYDCEEEQSRILSLVDYSGHMGSGDIVFHVTATTG